jgi:AcrR family transcriptional regulator
MIKDKDLLVLDAALFCFVEQGFHATQVVQIAKRSTVGEATIYRLYKTKDNLAEAVDAYVETLLTHRLQTSEAAPQLGESLQVWVERYWLLAAQVALSEPLAFTYWMRQRSALQSDRDKDGFSTLGPLKPIVNVIQRQINVQHISPFGEVLPLSRPLPLLATLLVTQWTAALESILVSHIHQTDRAVTASILQHSFESCWTGLQLPSHLIAKSLPTQKAFARISIPALTISLPKPTPTRSLTPIERLIVELMLNLTRKFLKTKVIPLLQSHVSLAKPVLKSHTLKGI